jgi:hypothetical protein
MYQVWVPSRPSNYEGLGSRGERVVDREEGVAELGRIRFKLFADILSNNFYSLLPLPSLFLGEFLLQDGVVHYIQAVVVRLFCISVLISSSPLRKKTL